MRILVCVKQVPDTAEIGIDPVTHSLVRTGAPNIVNPYDGYALEAAARIRDAHPDTKITVVSMGPEQAVDALRACLAIAADTAYLVSDRAFAGSDTLATSYALARSIQLLETMEGAYDAVFCGKQAIDGDTAQVGPGIAEHLGYPQVTNVWEAYPEKGELHAVQETAAGKAVIAVQMPCVITFTKPAWEPRYPTIKRKLAANSANIPVLRANDIPNLDKCRIGRNGSPTKVIKTYALEQRSNGVVIAEENGADAADRLLQALRNAHIV